MVDDTEIGETQAADGMEMSQRVFLGWDGPCLPRAAAWLVDRFGADMQQVIVALPVSRAGRRLIELLADLATQRGIPLAPPRIVTVGQLPELVVGEVGQAGENVGDVGGVAGDLSVLLAWVSALREADESELAAITVHQPARDRFLEWLPLAQDLMRLHSELAGHLIEPSDVGAMLDREMVEFPDAHRWEAIGSVYQRYQRALVDQQQIDRHTARQQALARGIEKGPGPIVLIGVAEMPVVTQQLLGQVAQDVTALVHAPEWESEAFDELGCVIESAWATRYFDAEHEQRMVDRPTDQTMAVLAAIRQGRRTGILSSGAAGGESSSESMGGMGRYRVDEITVGLGDETMARPMCRTLELAGLPARVATGSPWLESRPARLLSAVARYMPKRRFDDLSVLLRHPDLQNYLERQSVKTDADKKEERHAEEKVRGNVGGDVLTLLDMYVSQTLSRQVTDTWLLQPEKVGRLTQVVASIEQWIGVDANQARSLPAWSQVIAQMVSAVYDGQPLRRFVNEESALIEALGTLVQVLREQSALDDDLATTPGVTLADAIGLTLARVSGAAVPEPGGVAAIEILGWLELHLDDAPLLVITGFNEGLIPGASSMDSFLPDSARRILGLADHRQRYARDLMMITSIAHSRERLVLIAGRRDHDDNPLAPSRLMLARPAEELPSRILAFYQDRSEIGDDDAGDSAGALLRPEQLLFAGGGVVGGTEGGQFNVPRPEATEKQIERLLSRMPVTAFADYLRCPYRFYLKHVLRLESMNDRGVELDARLYGTMVHRVLEMFGGSAGAQLTDADDVATALDGYLDRVVHEQFGPTPRAAVRLQVALLQNRLRALAVWQAKQVRQGWRIVADRIEESASVELLDHEGRPATIRGRIDRIDRHDDGRVRLMDYKTSDTAADPMKNHVVKGEWVNLQLPLYVLLAQTMGLGCDKVELGFVRLSKSVGDDVYKSATWGANDLADAIDVARDVIGKIRDGVFWPPAEPVSRFEDDFSGICQDGCFHVDVKGDVSGDVGGEVGGGT